MNKFPSRANFKFFAEVQSCISCYIHQGKTSRMFTNQKKKGHNSTTAKFWQLLHSMQKSWGTSLYAASGSEGAVELQQADLGMRKCARQERPSWAGLGWAAEVPLRPE